MSKVVKALVSTILVLIAMSGCQTADPVKIPVEKNVYTFSDGETVSTYQFPNDNKLIYTLNNGTELLATDMSGPENHIVEGFLELNKNVQDRISAFYKQQGAIFDVNEYLEKAYTEYTNVEDPSEFRCYYISQDSFVSKVDDKAVYCITSCLLPIGGGLYETYSITQAFDKVTGILLSNELF